MTGADNNNKFVVVLGRGMGGLEVLGRGMGGLEGKTWQIGVARAMQQRSERRCDMARNNGRSNNTSWGPCEQHTQRVIAIDGRAPTRNKTRQHNIHTP